jgi:hypothetical protein
VATTPPQERDKMYQVVIKSVSGSETIIKTAKNEKSAGSVARYWLKKLDEQGVAGFAKWSEITEGGLTNAYNPRRD